MAKVTDKIHVYRLLDGLGGTLLARHVNTDELVADLGQTLRILAYAEIEFSLQVLSQMHASLHI